MAMSGDEENKDFKGELKKENWAKKLGYEKDKVVILHADDAGMCMEANIASLNFLQSNKNASASAMPPCEYFEDFINMAIANPGLDIGLHLTLNSEWDEYRWSSVMDNDKVQSLLDEHGFLWKKKQDFFQNAKLRDIDYEIRAQIEKCLELGFRPTHFDTHMGALFLKPNVASLFMSISEEYGIPANIINLSEESVKELYKAFDKEEVEGLIKALAKYPFPKLVHTGTINWPKEEPRKYSYKDIRKTFMKQLDDLKDGITSMYAHPTIYSKNLTTIMGTWWKRVWEDLLFKDVTDFNWENKDIEFTNWSEIMKRYNRLYFDPKPPIKKQLSD